MKITLALIGLIILSCRAFKASHPHSTNSLNGRKTCAGQTVKGLNVFVGQKLYGKSQMKTKLSKILLLLVLTPFMCLSAKAWDVSLNFTGVLTSASVTINNPSNPPYTPISIGDKVDWSLNYNMNFIQSASNISTGSNWTSYKTWGEGYQDFVLSCMVDGLYWQTPYSYTIMTITQGSTDSINFIGDPSEDGSVVLQLNDSTGTAFSSDTLPSSLNISEFDSGFFTLGNTGVGTGLGSNIIALYGVVEVPELSTIVLFGLGGMTLVILHRHKSQDSIAKR